MNCDELRDHYDLYALDIAEAPERDEIRAHLNRGCEVCTPGVKRSLGTATLIGVSAPPAEPSAKLRRRILASVGVEDRSGGWLPWWASALAIVGLGLVAVYLALGNREYEETAARLRTTLHEQTARIETLTEAFAILSGPNTTEASFGGAQPQPPQGKVFVNPRRGVLLIASNLPRTAADKIYEMWLIPKGAKPIPAGLFQSQEDGRAMHIQPGAVNVASTAAVAVTLEEQAGAAQPTTTPLIVAALPASLR